MRLSDRKARVLFGTHETLCDKVTIWCDKNLSKEMPIKKSFKRQTLSAISANCIANFLFAW